VDPYVRARRANLEGQPTSLRFDSLCFNVPFNSPGPALLDPAITPPLHAACVCFVSYAALRTLSLARFGRYRRLFYGA
jgi:hypothetical protein